MQTLSVAVPSLLFTQLGIERRETGREKRKEKERSICRLHLGINKIPLLGQHGHIKLALQNELDKETWACKSVGRHTVLPRWRVVPTQMVPLMFLVG